ncbi:NAD(P)(+) transhydrogenase (Re/Si-specific) subunit beta [Hirschia baltica]|uniref:NAD(P) transhydrogenase subunit beta n=1 Tax=Hirschia baltica (strain ATCC 49814 / DSM 5838 / IFAM 1418) TaxID=582402 RepID=C6XR83_HIRBI|nr:NAD(P)(+) transhydrogenase (Re/Si-specific) subunit beta [Hirschia baltica]ACT60614.1 NAD(P)(+) transhydrogenase (AB-specific) [Hirschia baltica ATCC 49814]
MSTVDISALLYLVCAVLFIFSIRGLSSPETARQGNKIGIFGMALAAATTLFLIKDNLDGVTFGLIAGGVAIGGGVGAVLATRAPMTSMPQMVGMFNALGGLASLLVALAAFYAPASFGLIGENGVMGPRSLVEMSLSALIGAITFSGSVIAALKLNGSLPGGPVLLPLRHWLNLAIVAGLVALTVMLAVSPVAQAGNGYLLLAIAALALIAGITLVLPIGGADMPVVISMLNSYSGWAAAALGFTLSNFALIVVGAIVGASGAILSYIMCKAMNRSFISVIAGGFGGDDADTSARADNSDKPVKIGSADDAAFILKNASKVIIVPGYGMAVAQAQHALKEMADSLKEAGVDVSYAIHPVAGRMPGHMNVLLAEAQVPYDEIYEMDDINSSFKQADVAFVIGANDVTNPGAKDDPASPIYGMPVLEVWNAGTTMFIKRSLASGYAGVQNDLFYRENTMMLLDDAKKMVENIVKAL